MQWGQDMVSKTAPHSKSNCAGSLLILSSSVWVTVVHKWDLFALPYLSDFHF